MTYIIEPVVGPTQRIIRELVYNDETYSPVIISYCILTHNRKKQAGALIVMGAYPDRLREMSRCEPGQISALAEQVKQHLREEEGNDLEFESKNPDITIL